MATIRKKIWPGYFDAVASGAKKYELRLDDFDVEEGDTLVLEEWNPDMHTYTGRSVERKVTYVGKFKIDKLFWPEEEIKKHGIQVLSLAEPFSGVRSLTLEVLSGACGICKLPANAPIPEWAKGAFLSITRTDGELSIVCSEENIPESVQCERGWRVMRVIGPLDFALTGILASLAMPLAEAGISIFALSTFDTDYLLVKNEKLEIAIKALTTAGHRVHI